MARRWDGFRGWLSWSFNNESQPCRKQAPLAVILGDRIVLEPGLARSPCVAWSGRYSGIISAMAPSGCHLSFILLSGLCVWFNEGRRGRCLSGVISFDVGSADVTRCAVVGVRTALTRRPPNGRERGCGASSALSARLPVMPEPGKLMTPTGTISSMRSFRLKGADLSSRFQLGLNAIRVIVR
jgi:hypothetical protein